MRGCSLFWLGRLSEAQFHLIIGGLLFSLQRTGPPSDGGSFALPRSRHAWLFPCLGWEGCPKRSFT